MENASKNGYEQYMLKEIYEQPEVTKNIINSLTEDNLVNLGESSFTKEELETINKIYIIGCGTALHAGEAGKQVLEKFLQKPIYTEIASEFKYNQPFVDENSLVIVVSQSGETGDTLAAMNEAKSKGAKILAVVNVENSTMAKNADKVIYCKAGQEVAIASTKVYVAQLVSLYLLAFDFAYKLNKIDKTQIESYITELKTIPEKIETILEKKDDIKSITTNLVNSTYIFYLGRGMDYFTAKEGSLKLKEVSYINTVAYPSGELKHGTIALIQDKTPVISIITQDELLDTSIGNIKEVQEYGAFTLAITSFDKENLISVADETILIPSTDDLFTPLLAVIPAQLLAYYTSLGMGNDVDQPRNLSKAVVNE